MADLPEPLLPADVDLRDFPDMPFAVQRFRDSGIANTKHPEQVIAALMLWCASWHQRPAGSLPSTDAELSPLAGYGRGVRDFLRVKAGALHRMVLCSDNRFWHPVIAAKAANCWNSKIRERHKWSLDRTRKANIERRARGEPELVLPGPPPLLKQDNSCSDGIPRWHYVDSNGNPVDDRRKSVRIPPEDDDEREGIPSDSTYKRSEVKRSEGIEVQKREALLPDGNAPPAINGHNDRGTRLSRTWKLPDAWRDWAIETYGIDAQRAVRISLNFRDYWIAKAGKEARKVDWEATWKVWVRKDMNDA